MYMDVHKYVRKVNIKRYFASIPGNTGTRVQQEYHHSGLSNASTFNPSGVMAPSLRVFRDVVLRDLDKIKISKFKMNKNLEEGLETLCKNKELVIRPADKGGGIVVLDRKDYLRELNKIVSDQNTYVPLIGNPIIQYRRTLEELIHKGGRLGILNEKEQLFLIPKAPRIPILYCLPKIHKSLTCPPGRPIVGGIDSITSRVGKYIDYFLQPLVQKVPSYLKDTKHVLNLLSQKSCNVDTWQRTSRPFIRLYLMTLVYQR